MQFVRSGRAGPVVAQIHVTASKNMRQVETSAGKVFFFFLTDHLFLQFMYLLFPFSFSLSYWLLIIISVTVSVL